MPLGRQILHYAAGSRPESAEDTQETRGINEFAVIARPHARRLALANCKAIARTKTSNLVTTKATNVTCQGMIQDIGERHESLSGVARIDM